jgi:hypothetical protein
LIVTRLGVATQLAKLIGACKMTNFLIKLLDAIPVPTPEQGDRAVMYTCTFAAGFVFCMLVNGL